MLKIKRTKRTLRLVVQKRHIITYFTMSQIGTLQTVKNRQIACYAFGKIVLRLQTVDQISTRTRTTVQLRKISIVVNNITAR